MAAMARAAIRRLDQLERSGEIPREIAQVHRLRLRTRLDEFGAATETGTERAARAAGLYRKAQQRLVEAQRAALNELRERGQIDNTVQRRLTRVLDLQTVEAQLLESTGRVDPEAE